MLSKQQATTMLELQAKMNAKVNPAWLSAGYPYLRAVVIEAAEAMEHHGWKWWKAQRCDMAQLQMELVDIWHFILSYLLIEESGNIAASVKHLQSIDTEQTTIAFDHQTYTLSELDLISKLELMIGLATARKINLPLFHALIKDCNMDWDELFCQYVGKNVLNFFRQDNGYKEGTYIKIWSKREDNEHLVEIMAELDASDPEFQDRLYYSLNERYRNTEKNQ